MSVHRNPARATNYVLAFDDLPEVTYAVQDAEIVGLTLGETPFGSRVKDLVLPSNKVDTAPVSFTIIISEDFKEYNDMIQWVYQCAYGSDLQEKFKTITLTVLDSSEKEVCSYTYVDCFPIELGAVQLQANTDESSILTFDLTLRFNDFKAMVGNVIINKIDQSE